MSKEIILTQGQVTIVDNDTYNDLSKWKWQAMKHHTGSYYVARTCRIGKQKKVSMHRYLMGTDNPEILVDHKDRNGLNNQKNNLRICTPAENAKNRVSKRGATSKYLGVYIGTARKTYNTKRGVITNVKTSYRAKIKTEKKEVSLGTFPFTPDGEILAAKAYDKAAIKYHKEFANLNFKENE